MSFMINPFVMFPADAGDPNFASVSSLLHMDGADGSTIFTDVTGQTITAFGNAQIDTAQSKFGGASGLFDGAGDYLTFPNAAQNVLGTGDFTIEAFVRIASFSMPNTLFSTGDTSTDNGVLFTINASGALQIFGSTTSLAGGSVSLNTWTHIAFTRSGTTAEGFVDGVSAVTGTLSRNLTANTSIHIGARNFSSSLGDYFNGHIDEFRLTKGVNRYPAAFTPPTAPFPDS